MFNKYVSYQQSHVDKEGNLCSSGSLNDLRLDSLKQVWWFAYTSLSDNTNIEQDCCEFLFWLDEYMGDGWSIENVYLDIYGEYESLSELWNKWLEQRK